MPARAYVAPVPAARLANGRGNVVRLQRARIVSAMVEVVAERGVARSTVAHVVARSGVSRRTFYELFEDREDCFLAAFDLAVERAAARVVPAYGEGGGWLERIRMGLRAVLEFLDDEPALGRLGIVDALGAGPVALERRTRVVGALIDAVDRGRRERIAGARLTRLTAEGIVGAVLAVLHARLAKHEPRPMISLSGPLMGLIVLPYQGRVVAEREAARPAPRRRPAMPPVANPLRDLHMRLTYRTVRVLVAIASVPGASNREVSNAAGVADQGQMSKLLIRLEHLGLIVNVGEGHAKGEPNAWQLTQRGHEVEWTISRQTEQAAVG
jgi:AcrR family transcriptional regulator